MCNIFGLLTKYLPTFDPIWNFRFLRINSNQIVTDDLGIGIEIAFLLSGESI
jgi:hypothetical protein